MDTPPHRARLEGKVECHLPDIPHCKGRWVVSPLISDPILSFSTSFLGTLACSLCVRCCRWVLAARVSEMPEPPQIIPWRRRPRCSKRSNGSTAGHRALEPQGTTHQHLQEGIRRPRASLSLPPGWTGLEFLGAPRSEGFAIALPWSQQTVSAARRHGSGLDARRRAPIWEWVPTPAAGTGSRVDGAGAAARVGQGRAALDPDRRGKACTGAGARRTGAAVLRSKPAGESLRWS